MAKILIKNGRVWDGERFFCADVLTDGQKIASIAPNIDEAHDYLYDASGKIVSAGLVDVHVHMRATPTDRYGIQAEMSCFPFGVTAAADAGREDGEGAVFDSFMLKNLIFVTVAIENNRAMIERAELNIARFGDRVVGVKVYFDTGESDVRDVEPLRDICAFAKERGLRVMVHCAGSPCPMSEILDVLNEGDILTHVFHGGVNNAADDDFESLKKAKSRGVVIDAGFAGHVHTDFDIFKRATESGFVPNTLSTDVTKLSAFVRGGRYGMTLCMSLARLAGMSEEDIFRCVTSNAARVLGKEKEWGSLRVGGAADIAVLEYTSEGFDLTDKYGNRVRSDNGYRCRLTLSDGQIVYRD